MTSAPQPTHLPSSKLGTKEYWDTTYTADLTTQATHPSHTGHTWFADVRASQKLLAYLLSPPPSANLTLDPKTTTFLDLGTGNGEMLFLLREKGGFEGMMVGVDYSAQSVELCRRVAGGKGVALGVGVDVTRDGEPGILFHQWDILHCAPPHPSWTSCGFDVVLDKGTFDAVGLSEERDKRGRKAVEGYRDVVVGLVRRGGVFVVTSCNWTEGELRGWFEGGGVGGLVCCGRVEYPVFRFGGGQGQSVQSVVFRRM